MVEGGLLCTLLSLQPQYLAFLLAAKNGVVIATEKKLPTCLIDETSVQKIVMLTENIAVVYSGIGVMCQRI
eukprot:6181471-Pleurochrysis_carterae.AAC.4